MTAQTSNKLTQSSAYIVLTLLLAAYTICAPTTHAENEVLQDDSSTIDLRKQSWGQGEVFSLQSSWQFTWKVFTHDSTARDKHEWHNVHIPGSWSHHFNEQPESESPLPPQGYGTYYKKILVPKSVEKAFIHLPDMASAYEIWHRGKKLGGNGVISTIKESEQADYLPRVYELTPENGEIEIFVKTSNYHYLWGGIWYAPTLTDETGVHKIRELPILKAMTSGSILLATAVFCFFMYLSRKQDRKLLFFSLFCLAIGVRRLCMDERVLYLLNHFDWETLQAAENVSLYLMLPLFLNYFRLTFPQTTTKHLPLLGWVCIIPFCIAALFSQVETYTGFNPYYQIVVLAFLPFILLGWARAFRAKLRHSKLFGISLLVFVAAVINDMLNYSYIIRTTNLTHLGVLAFVLFQLAGLISRYLANFRAIESLSQTLKEKNKALVQHDEFKDDFLASTSHELRMPLHGMAGLAKSVRQDSTNLSSESNSKIRLIESTALRLENLVNDILDISSIKHGKLSIQKHPAHLAPLVESTIQSLESLIKHKPIDLSFNVEDDARVILADEQRVQQILYNLIGNAIKFTKEGRIELTAQAKDNIIEVRVRDTGIGMSIEQQKTALQAYETNSSLQNSLHQNEIKGTGLGLPITKMLVELHGGTLVLESEEGVGTEVRFTLPKSDEKVVIDDQSPLNGISASILENEQVSSIPAEDARESILDKNYFKQVSKSSLTQNALIFYADDEEVNRELVSSQLLNTGYRVKTFVDGQSLLDELSKGSSTVEMPELALLDWVMPGKDGLEVCTEIRQRHNASDLPIIMLTAKHQINNIVQAFNAGANDYLTKPYHEQELIARVSSQISVKRLMLATIENENLKVEVARQEHQKQQLSTVNQRLESTLESSQENVILLNEDLDIIYSNSGAQSLLGLDSSTDNELAFTHLMSDTSIEVTKKLLNSEESDNDNQALRLELRQDSALTPQDALKTIEATACVTDIDNDRFISLILNDEKSHADQKTQELLSSLTQEIAENRQRMEHIESTLLQLNDGPVVIEPTAIEPIALKPEGIEQEVSETTPARTQNAIDPKELVVKTLQTTLIAWERYTHKTKAELAEASHCWRVYLDGATAKTRTLDKYLAVKTLPAKPRWRAVVKTANYVLDNCELNEKDQNELDMLIQELTDAFS